MNNEKLTNTSFRLSAEEICVIAGILNYPIVFGVNVNMAERWKRELPQRTKSIIRKLEQKKHIRVGLEGVVSVNIYLQKAIGVICLPDKLMMIVDHEKRHEDQSIYVMEKEDSFICLSRVGEEYTLALSDRVPSIYAFRTREDYKKDISLELSLTQYDRISERIRIFEEDNALEIARTIICDHESAELLLSLIRKPMITLTVFQNREKQLTKENRLQFVRYSDSLFQVISDNDSVTYKSVAYSEVEQLITRCF
jgi:hypothetical protein